MGERAEAGQVKIHSRLANPGFPVGRGLIPSLFNGISKRRWEWDIGEGPHGSQSRVVVLVILYISLRHANVEQLLLFR